MSPIFPSFLSKLLLRLISTPLPYPFRNLEKIILLAWLKDRLISAGLEPVLGHVEKSCMATRIIDYFLQILK